MTGQVPAQGKIYIYKTKKVRCPAKLYIHVVPDQENYVRETEDLHVTGPKQYIMRGEAKIWRALQEYNEK